MLIPLLFLTLSTTQPAIIDDALRGSSLYKDCKEGITFHDAGRPASTYAGAMASNSCLGYIKGFVQAFQLSGTKFICAEDARWGTMARVFVAYMDSHPKLMDQHMAVDLSEALMDAYPCPTAK